MTLLPADAYPMFDFRHGPQSNVSPQMLVTALLSDTAQQQEAAFLKDMHAFGGIIWGICEKASQEIHKTTHYLLELRSNLSELARLPLYLPAVQTMANYRSLALGLNPDEPRNLSYWIKPPHKVRYTHPKERTLCHLKALQATPAPKWAAALPENCMIISSLNW